MHKVEQLLNTIFKGALLRFERKYLREWFSREGFQAIFSHVEFIPSDAHKRGGALSIVVNYQGEVMRIQQCVAKMFECYRKKVSDEIKRGNTPQSSRAAPFKIPPPQTCNVQTSIRMNIGGQFVSLGHVIPTSVQELKVPECTIWCRRIESIQGYVCKVKTPKRLKTDTAHQTLHTSTPTRVFAQEISTATLPVPPTVQSRLESLHTLGKSSDDRSINSNTFTGEVDLLSSLEGFDKIEACIR